MSDLIIGAIFLTLLAALMLTAACNQDDPEDF